MAGNIDERIVEMSFKAASFISQVKSTIDALSSLKNGLNNLKGSADGINSLDESAKRFSLSGMANGISDVTHRFNLLHIAGLTVFTSLVRQGLFAGESLLKSFTIDPIKAGLDVYETKINAIQTILANTSAEGTKLKDVTAALNTLNVYANKTVYNFGQMAKNIGTFTAAGVDLKTSVSSIKGIANLAALSGSSAEQASTAMYQLSQAIAAGRVKLQDWNSVVNAGLGGKVFQNALIEDARAHGVAIDAMIKKDNGFRNTLQTGWLTSKILTDTLATFTGDLNTQQLRAMGYTAQEAAAIQKQGAIAVQSATQIRTVSQLMQALKEEVATAWASVFQAIIGNSTQAATTLSSFHNIAESALTKPIYALGKILQSFTDMGGREIIIKAISNAFHALGAILGTVGSAFRAVFPTSGAGASNTLLNMAKAVERFTAALTPSATTLASLKTIFEGVFSVIKIVIDVVSALIGGLFQIGGATTHASGGFLAFIAVIASWVINLRKAIESGTALQTFFKTLGTIIAFPIKIIGDLIGWLGSFGHAAGAAASAGTSFISKIAGVFSKLGSAIGAAIQNGNFSAIIGIFNQLLLGGVLLGIRKFIGNIGNLFKGSGGEGGGLFATIKESFSSLTDTLKTMQQDLKAGILEKIAIAVGILAASLLVLSLINVKDLVKALAAITVLFLELGIAMKAITGSGTDAGVVKIVAIGAGLDLLATAILILAGAVAILAQFSWTQLAKGLSAIAILLAELVGVTLLMSADSKGLITSAIAMQVMAVALNILALAVGRLGSEPLGNLVKGVGAIAALLLILAGFNAISGAQLISTAVAMAILGGALKIIASAVDTLGSQSVGTLAKGLGSVAAALGIIALAMNLMPPTMIATSVSLVLVATSMVILSKAIKSFGGMSIGEISKALVVLAGSLGIIAAAMFLMTGALPGAAALIVVAGALAILTPVLLALGNMSWTSIIKGLVTLAGVFLILAAGGALLTPLIPTLLGLGLAITLLGVGILAAGLGVAAFAVGLTALAVAVTASGVAIVAFVSSILSLLPLAAKELGLSITSFASTIGKGAVAITSAFTAILTSIFDAIVKTAPKAEKAFTAIITSMLGAINKNAPKMITTFGNLILHVLEAMIKYVPRFVSSGATLIVSILKGIGAHIGQVVSAGTNVIISFINAIGNGIGRIVAAGVRMVISLVNGIANRIRASSGQIHAASANLASAIIEGMVAGITGGIGAVIGAAVNMAKSALNAAKSALGINSPSKAFHDEVGVGIPEGTALGIKHSTGLVNDQVKVMGNSMLDTLGKTLSGLNDTVSSNLDLQPRITPVIDLTQAKKGFGDLNNLSKSQLIAAGGSTSSAASIANMTAASKAAASSVSSGGTSLTFYQTIKSPEAVSATTVYRQTKNQLSVAKGALSANSR